MHLRAAEYDAALVSEGRAVSCPEMATSRKIARVARKTQNKREQKTTQVRTALSRESLRRRNGNNAATLTHFQSISTTAYQAKLAIDQPTPQKFTCSPSSRAIPAFACSVKSAAWASFEYTT